MDPAHIGVISTAVVGILTALVSAYIAIRKNMQEQSVTRESFIVNELKNLIDRQDAEFESRMESQAAEFRSRIADLRRERDAALSRLSMCAEDYSSARERVTLYESLLSQHKIPFRAWNPPSAGGSTPLMDTVQDGSDG